MFLTSTMVATLLAVSLAAPDLDFTDRPIHISGDVGDPPDREPVGSHNIDPPDEPPQTQRQPSPRPAKAPPKAMTEMQRQLKPAEVRRAASLAGLSPNQIEELLRRQAAIWKAARVVDEVLAVDTFVTSKGRFRTNSLAHMRGGLDLRAKDLPPGFAVRRAIAISKQLGPDFVVVMEFRDPSSKSVVHHAFSNGHKGKTKVYPIEDSNTDETHLHVQPQRPLPAPPRPPAPAPAASPKPKKDTTAGGGERSPNADRR